MFAEVDLYDSIYTYIKKLLLFEIFNKRIANGDWERKKERKEQENIRLSESE